VVEGCDPTYGAFGIRTGHDCHADILPKVTVNVAKPPRQPFSCAAKEDPRQGDSQAGGMVLQVGGCGRTPYGLYVYIFDEACEPKNDCPPGYSDFGFVVAAPSRGWTMEDFREAVRQSMDEFVLAGGRYHGNADSAVIRVPIAPGTRLQDTTWVATDTGSSHVVTFRWRGPSKEDANILDDTGAPGFFGPLAGSYEQWPTATGHVTAPDARGAGPRLLQSTGAGCFTIAGLPTAADTNPKGVLVDLRAATAPVVRELATSDLPGACP